MFLDTITLLSRKREQAYRQRRAEKVLKITIAMISGLTIGLAVMNYCTKKSKSQSHADLKEQAAQAINAVMDTVDGIEDETETIKEEIKSDYEDVKQETEETIEKISNSWDDKSE